MGVFDPTEIAVVIDRLATVMDLPLSPTNTAASAAAPAGALKKTTPEKPNALTTISAMLLRAVVNWSTGEHDVIMAPDLNEAFKEAMEQSSNTDRADIILELWNEVLNPETRDQFDKALQFDPDKGHIT